MRKRLRKKAEVKRIATAKKLFKLKKAMVIAELVASTSQAYAKLIDQPLATRPILALHIKNNFEIQRRVIAGATFNDNTPCMIDTLEEDNNDVR